MKTTIYLIRHGVTAANKDDIFAGRTQEPLHSEGLIQLAEVGKRLACREISRIFCGPLTRTRQSAFIAGELLAAPVAIEEALNEISIPHWDGLTKATIRKMFGAEYPTWLAAPGGFSVSGCETIAEVQARSVACFENILRDYAGQNVLVISHLIVIRALLLHYLQRPISDFRMIKVGNAQVATIIRDELGTTAVEF